MAAIARAEEAERQSAAKIREADEMIQKAMERAAQLEKKFADAMQGVKQLEGNRCMQPFDLNLQKRLMHIHRANGCGYSNRCRCTPAGFT